MSNLSGRLTELRSYLKKKKLAGFVIPSNDEFQSEYCPAHARRLEWLTGFTGSNGVAVVLENAAAFFTDGRYTLQARAEVSRNHYQIFDLAEKRPWEWAAEHLGKGALGLDPWLHPENSVTQYRDRMDVVLVKENPVDCVWNDRPLFPDSEIKLHPLEYTGQDSDKKIINIAQAIAAKNAHACILTSPDSVCWLLNIRGNDVPNTPFVLAYAVIYADGEVTVFADDVKVPHAVRDHFGGKVRFVPRAALEKEIKPLQGKTVWIDPSATPYWFSEYLKRATIIRAQDPCQLPKACKNEVEATGTREAHRLDGVAVTRFLHWLHDNVSKQKLTEVSISRKLLNFRRECATFRGPSFDTIAGFASNGAIVHYRPSDQSDSEIKGENLLLLDSGGQYLQGTTDITRTLAIGTPTKEHKERYTLVLKGHIALARAVFPKGTTGTQLDILARHYLWQAGLDYDHGTGHGVGSYLSVHEGPQRIGKAASTAALKPGMILSNEPGYYKEGEYGIRIENLVMVVERPDLDKDGRTFYGFETLTLVPFDSQLIDKTLLTKEEKAWLENYYERIEAEIMPQLDKPAKAWLKKML